MTGRDAGPANFPEVWPRLFFKRQRQTSMQLA
jgi:hypothetical protein